MDKHARGLQFLSQHQYKKAEALLKVSDYRARKSGSIYRATQETHYAIALAGQSKFKPAIDHINNIIIPNRPHSVSHHEILFGICEWYLGEHSSAIDAWKRALKSGYASDRGCSDVFGMLHFASVHAPRLFSQQELVELIPKYRKRLGCPDYFPDKILAFMLDEFDERVLMGYTILLNLGFNEFNQQVSGISVLNDRGRAYYHMALKNFNKTNLREYTNNMRMCVDTSYTHYHIEFLIAYLEVQRLDAEYPVEYFKKC
jgi:tetratricopeptide (TPR) repeat protein